MTTCPLCNRKVLGVIPYVGGHKLYAHEQRSGDYGDPYWEGCFVLGTHPLGEEKGLASGPTDGHGRNADPQPE